MNQRVKVFQAAILAFLSLFLFACISQADITTEELQNITKAMPEKASAVPKQSRKLLVFTLCKGFKHSSIPYAAKALEIMGQKTGAFTTVQSEDLAIFNSKDLKKYDAICFVNTTQLGFEDENMRRNLIDFIKKGKGIIGIHAATDNFYEWPEGAAMMGGLFDGHPWTGNGVWAVKIDDPEHPVNAGFAGKNFKINDEIYRIKNFASRERVRVLLSLDLTDEATLTAKGVRPTDIDIPISWVRSYGKGRLFYCSLGHNHHIFWNTSVLQHYLDGIQFALGDLQVDANPSLDRALARVATYEFGQSREPLTEISDFIRANVDSIQVIQRLEQRFVKLLQSDATYAGKDFICRNLSLIGTSTSVPVLATMLTNEKTSDMARYALERIPDPVVDQVLLAALPNTGGNVKVGIVNSLGERRDARSAPVLVTLVNDSDPVVAQAVIAALGKISDDQAIAALNKARQTATGKMRSLVLDAYLMCADKLLANGNRAGAFEIYQQCYVPTEPIQIRFAALRGLAYSTTENIGDMIIRVLKSDDLAMHTAATSLVSEIKEPEKIREVAEELPNLSITAQLQLISALANRKDPIVRQAVEKAVESDQPEVRVAALAALSTLGDENSISLLAIEAATTQGDERDAARESLNRLRGVRVDDTILTWIIGAKPEVKVELIRTVGERCIKTATSTILKTATDMDANVRLESIKVLKVIADENHLKELVDLLVHPKSESERRELEKTVVAVAAKIPKKERQGEVILAMLPTVKDSNTRSSLLQVLGSIGDPTALPVLKAALADNNTEFQTAAIRALSEWPTAGPETELWNVARISKNKVQQVLALRGFVRLIGLESDRPMMETIKMYQEAMALAPDANEKKKVLSGLANIKSLAAFEMAAGYLEDGSLQQEARAALVNIAESISGSYPAEVQPVLVKVANETTIESQKTQVERLLARIESFEDYITAWQVSGPYLQKDVKLFDHAFEPEQPDTKKISWRLMPAGTNRDTPWLLNLEEVIGGEDRVAYLRTNIWSDNKQETRLELGSDDGIKVWLNDELVHSKDIIRGVTPADDVVQVILNEGKNTLMLKVVQISGGWGACARIRSQEGGKVEGLRVRVEED